MSRSSGERCPLVTPRAKRKGAAAEVLANAFRALPIPVIGRIKDGTFILDLRCLDDEPAFVKQLSQLEISRFAP